MKTLKSIQMMMSVLSLGLSVGCANTSNDSAATSTTSTTYSISGNTCYSSSTGQAVAMSYCTSAAYYMVNGYCYQTSTGSMVSTSYCTASGYYLNNGVCYSSSGQVVSTSYCTTTTSTAGACYGTYYYTNGYTSQFVACYGLNCRGYTLYTYPGFQRVTCQ